MPSTKYSVKCADFLTTKLNCSDNFSISTLFKFLNKKPRILLVSPPLKSEDALAVWEEKQKITICHKITKQENKYYTSLKYDLYYISTSFGKSN